jgi:hypothetical protein
MGRRTKEELLSSNYYEWLEYCNTLRQKKADGIKLIPAEKQVMRSVPTPENPFVSKKSDAAEPPKKKKSVKTKVDFTRDVVWSTKGQSFLCAVFNLPYTDEMCMLFCERDDCPFHGEGYFRAKGIKF